MHDDERDPGRDVERLLRLLDHPLPSVTAEDVVARARERGHEAPDGPAGSGKALGVSTTGIRRVSRRIAAGMLLLLGLSGVAYAAPGSPLPGWVDSVARWIGYGSRPAGSSDQVPEATRAAGGVALGPGVPLRVDVRSRRPDGYVRIALTDDSLTTVRLSPEAGSLTSEPGPLGLERLGVDLSGPDTVDIRVAGAAAHLEVRVRGRTVFQKAGDEVTATSGPGPGGVYLVRVEPGG
ncbi:MAG: hypothetical protein PVI57_13665 [Gemmatimonadota bacterium]|jgi:hypothetical protein